MNGSSIRSSAQNSDARMLLCSHSAIVADLELRVLLLHFFDVVTADEAHAGDVVGREGVERPIQQPPARYFGKALRGVRGGGHQPLAPAGTNHDDSHSRPSRSTRIITVLIIANPYATAATFNSQLTALVP